MVDEIASIEGEWVEGLGKEGRDEVSEPQEELPELEPEAVTAFPEKWKEDFIGLAYLGYLEDKVEIPFHTFIVRNLLPAEKLEVTRLTREFEGSIGYSRAYKSAIVAGGIETVDGQPIITVASQKKIGALRQKFDYVINSWYDPVIELLYQKIDELEGRMYEVMREMGVLPQLDDEPPE